MAVPYNTAIPGSPRLRAMAHCRLRVGEHVVDIGSLRILTSPDAQRLTPKSAAVLLELACNAGKTVSRNELLDTVWSGTCPTPDVLTQAITDLRRVLGDEAHTRRYIETVPKIGYRLIAEVEFSDGDKARDMPAYPVAVAPATNDRRPESRAARRIGLLLLAAAVIGVIGIAVYRSQQAWPVLTGSRNAGDWSVRDMRTLTTDPGAEKYPRLAPDGTRIAYSASDVSQRNFRLLVRTLEQARPLRLGVNEDGQESYPVWSPDGASIAFLRYSAARCEVILTPAMGGQERTLRPCFNEEVNYFAWTPDGRKLITTSFTHEAAGDLEIALMPLDGSESRALAYSHAAWDKDIDARYSPDGRWIAFRRGARPYADLWIVPAAGGEARRLTRFCEPAARSRLDPRQHGTRAFVEP